MCWACNNPNNDDLTYTLYLSKPQTKQQSPAILPSGSNKSISSGLAAVYIGKNTSYTIDTLESGMVYNWQVQVANQYGVVSESPEYSFTTIKEPTKAFNYPNPFDPARGQSTNIVFEMTEDGDVDIKIYSEYGDRCLAAVLPVFTRDKPGRIQRQRRKWKHDV